MLALLLLCVSIVVVENFVADVLDVIVDIFDGFVVFDVFIDVLDGLVVFDIIADVLDVAVNVGVDILNCFVVVNIFVYLLDFHSVLLLRCFASLGSFLGTPITLVQTVAY